MGVPLGPNEALQFPYGVVEIKLQAKPPAWIKQLVQSGEFWLYEPSLSSTIIYHSAFDSRVLQTNSRAWEVQQGYLHCRCVASEVLLAGDI